MSFLSPADIATITGGRWLDTPPESLIGVGTDTRDDLTGRLFIALRGERFDAHDFLEAAKKQGAAAALVEREVPGHGLPRLLVKDALVALQSMAAAWRQRMPNAWCVAITGSAGKTTTRRLVEAACAAIGPTHASPKSFNNHLGVPLTLLGAPIDTRFLVIEIGMNHPGEIAPLSRMAAPRVAMVMNAGTAHLGGMGSREAIAVEKCSIARGLQPAGLFVVHGDQEHLFREAVKQPMPPSGKLYGFGTRGMNAFRLRGRTQRPDGTQVVQAHTPQGPLEFTLQLPGAHNAMNAVGALAALVSLGLPAAQVAEAFGTVAPADMRLVRSDIGGVAVFNDAYNANPDSVLAAGGRAHLRRDDRRLHAQGGGAWRHAGTWRRGPCSARDGGRSAGAGLRGWPARSVHCLWATLCAHGRGSARRLRRGKCAAFSGFGRGCAPSCRTASARRRAAGEGFTRQRHGASGRRHFFCTGSEEGEPREPMNGFEVRHALQSG
ncbi:MAG: UDP-N-acetylmuramoyl-tripeptide--D-alanyl-D-alanine ligase [Planctomycetes bacterium]|nr:UDP-N-acetylmuramoyl-tripeptide--D-alanyl-D-alanine ligase [Planctomycetota bacterium]